MSIELKGIKPLEPDSSVNSGKDSSYSNKGLQLEEQVSYSMKQIVISMFGNSTSI